MRIGIDIMGGDFAPQTTTLGAILAQRELAENGVELVLIGDQKAIEPLLEEHKTWHF